MSARPLAMLALALALATPPLTLGGCDQHIVAIVALKSAQVDDPLTVTTTFCNHPCTNCGECNPGVNGCLDGQVLELTGEPTTLALRSAADREFSLKLVVAERECPGIVRITVDDSDELPVDISVRIDCRFPQSLSIAADVKGGAKTTADAQLCTLP